MVSTSFLPGWLFLYGTGGFWLLPAKVSLKLLYHILALLRWGENDISGNFWRLPSADQPDNPKSVPKAVEISFFDIF